MSQRRAYKKPEASIRSRLRKEWVEIDGGDVCCWELTSSEMMELGERSAVPAIDPRGGVNRKAAAGWLIALSVHHGEEEESPRIWNDLTWEEVLDLRAEEFTKLQEAISRVMGTGAAEVEAQKDFTTASGAPSTSGLSPSASSISTASRRKSMSPTTNSSRR